MKCDDFRAAYISGSVGDDEHQHLAECSDCRNEQPSLDGLRRLLADAAMWEQPSGQLEEQVVGLISNKEPPLQEASGGRRSWRTSLVASAAVAVLLLGSLAIWASLRSPGADWEVAISGTDQAPTAAAVVEGWNEPAGTRLIMTVDGLAAAPEGSVYELWFTKGEVHVSAGTFTGPGEVDLWVGVSRRDYPRLWVTLEPIDEDESPSRVTVLDTAS